MNSIVSKNLLSKLKEVEDFVKLEAKKRKPDIKCPFGKFIDTYMIVERTKKELLPKYCMEETMSHSSRDCPYRDWGDCKDGDISSNTQKKDAFCKRVMKKYVKEEGPII